MADFTAETKFPRVAEWWRQQGSRPVWPGIATQRIGGSEDGRKASEIISQIDIARKIGRNWNGHIHWSAKSLVTNQGGIATQLAGTYTQPAAVPPMPWISKAAPASPGVGASVQGDNTFIRWVPDGNTAKIAVQARNGGTWRTMKIGPVSTGNLTIPRADAIAVTAHRSIRKRQSAESVRSALARRNPRNPMKTHPNLILLAVVAPVTAWSAWRPFDNVTWWLEVTPVFHRLHRALHRPGKGLAVLRSRALVLIGFHMIILLVGGHYTYALVPIGDWASDLFHSSETTTTGSATSPRDSFRPSSAGRFSCASGVIARRGWLAFCVVSFCLAFSATYELIEWAAALISAEAAESFLGTQGDGWDTQWDMFLAGIGALFAVTLLPAFTIAPSRGWKRA